MADRLQLLHFLAAIAFGLSMMVSDSSRVIAGFLVFFGVMFLFAIPPS